MFLKAWGVVGSTFRAMELVQVFKTIAECWSVMRESGVIYAACRMRHATLRQRALPSPQVGDLAEMNVLLQSSATCTVRILGQGRPRKQLLLCRNGVHK